MVLFRTGVLLLCRTNAYFVVTPRTTSLSGISAGDNKFTAKWNKKTTKKTIKGLKNKQKYYVQVRTYKTVKGVKYYSSWYKAKSEKTK